jgi:hypothetical protein
MIKDKKILFDIDDGPEGITIYTSDEEGVVDWGNDLPALYLEASLHGANFKLGPFQLSTIRKYFEEAAKKNDTDK